MTALQETLPSSTPRRTLLARKQENYLQAALFSEQSRMKLLTKRFLDDCQVPFIQSGRDQGARK